MEVDLLVIPDDNDVKYVNVHGFVDDLRVLAYDNDDDVNLNDGGGVVVNVME